MGDVTSRGYRVEELKAVFDIVKNKDGWKAPIMATVAMDDLDAVCASIEYYVGTIPKVIILDLDCEKFMVVRGGYRNGPCGATIR